MSRTMHLNAHEPNAIARAAACVKAGQLVVFPTDTVYGIGVDPYSEDALERLYAAKQRVREKGIPILIADSAEIDRLAIVPREQRSWIDTLTTLYWPGPLTLVLPKNPSLPPNISPNDAIALRIPDNTIARRLIRAAGGAIATSSANLSGAPPATSGEEAMTTFDGIAAAIVDGGPSLGGVPSTVFDCTQFPPRVLRQGPVPAHILRPDPEELR